MKRCKQTFELFEYRAQPTADVLRFPAKRWGRTIWGPMVETTAETILYLDFDTMAEIFAEIKSGLVPRLKAAGADDHEAEQQYMAFQRAVLQRYDVKCESG